MSLPRWMEPLLEAGESRELDRWAINEKRIASDELMERAGEGLAGVVARRAPAGRIAIVCGKGNNGGDGIVAARLLRQAGREVELHAVWPPEWMGDDAQAQLKKLPGPPPIPFEAGRLNKAHLIVDALLGTGSSGSPRGPADKVIEEMEAARAPVVACDVPSGVDASTGEVEGPAVHCVATAVFHRPKVGLWIRPGKEYAGEVEVVDIGIPRGGPARPEAGGVRGPGAGGGPRGAGGPPAGRPREGFHHGAGG